MRGKRLASSVAAIACILHASPARAQNAAPAEEADSAEVRVIGNRADSLQKVPGSGTVITPEQFERRQPYNIGEMLRTVPGVQLREDYGSGNRIDLSIRGVESGRSRKVLMLEDGIPISLNPYAESDMNFGPPVERMRAIEVVKGSGNILFGPQTVAGVINFVTLAPPDAMHLVADFEGGQRGYTRELAQYGDAYGNMRWVGQVAHKNGDGFREIGFDVTDVFQKFAYQTSPHGETVLKLGFHREVVDSDAVGLTRAIYAADPETPKLAKNDRQKGNLYQVSATHEERFSTSTKLRALLYAYRTDRVWRRQAYDRAAAPSTPYESIVGDPLFPGGAIFFKPTDTVLDRDYDVLGFEPRFEHRFRTLGFGHTLDFGGRVLTESAHYQQRTGTTSSSYSGSLDYEERHRTLALAGYVQDRIAVRDDLLVTPGVRFERADLTRTITRQNSGAGVEDVSIDGSNLSWGVIPGLGMVYGQRNFNVFAGLHEGWGPPRITAAVVPNGRPTQLQPEESINYELGTRFRVKDWLRFEETGFLSNFRNQTISNSSATGGSEETNGGATRIYGSESGVVLAIGSLVHAPLIVDLGARYTYAHATFVNGTFDGRFLPYAPLHSFNTNLDVEKDIPSGKLGGQLAYAFVSDQFTDAVNTIDEDATGRIGRIGPRHIVDATVHYAHSRSGLSLRLSVKNLTNDAYIAARRPEGISASGFRQIIAGVRWVYDKAPTAP